MEDMRRELETTRAETAALKAAAEEAERATRATATADESERASRAAEHGPENPTGHYHNNHFVEEVFQSVTTAGHQRRRSVFLELAIALCAVVFFANTSSVAASMAPLDWGEWDQKPNNVVDPAGSEYGPTHIGGDQPRGTLHRLVDDCVRMLELPGFDCHTHGRHFDNYSVPFMYAADPSCGFQTRMQNEALEDLASRYTFFFIGDSTTRRLAESFVSILTGQAFAHEVVHDRIDMSRENLKVTFHWAPYCSGRKGVGETVRTVMSGHEVSKLSNGGRRAVIFTAFGVHDARESLANERWGNETSYVKALSPDIVAKEGTEAAAIATCEEVTSQLLHVAKSTTVRQQREGKPQGSDRRGLAVSVDLDRDFEDANDTPSSERGVRSSSFVDDDIPPLVFLGQNNPYPFDSDEDRFLERLHDVQDRVLQGAVTNTTGQGAEDGVFIIHDRDSLYRPMWCCRIGNSIHFLEPVKLVEGNLFWHLVMLVDGWNF